MYEQKNKQTKTYSSAQKKKKNKKTGKSNRKKWFKILPADLILQAISSNISDKHT